MIDIINYVDANMLRDFIEYEILRRRKTMTTQPVTLGDLASTEWWQSLKADIEQVIPLDYEDIADDFVITIEMREKFIEKAIELYKGIVSQS